MTGLERLRLDKLMTVTELAEATKVAPGTIRRIEDGKPTTVKTLAKLSTYFSVPASTLVREVSRDDLGRAA